MSLCVNLPKVARKWGGGDGGGGGRGGESPMRWKETQRAVAVQPPCRARTFKKSVARLPESPRVLRSGLDRENGRGLEVEVLLDRPVSQQNSSTRLLAMDRNYAL